MVVDRVTRRRLGLGTLAMTADATLTVCARRVLGGVVQDGPGSNPASPLICQPSVLSRPES